MAIFRFFHEARRLKKRDTGARRWHIQIVEHDKISDPVQLVMLMAQETLSLILRQPSDTGARRGKHDSGIVFLQKHMAGQETGEHCDEGRTDGKASPLCF